MLSHNLVWLWIGMDVAIRWFMNAAREFISHKFEISKQRRDLKFKSNELITSRTENAVCD